MDASAPIPPPHTPPHPRIINVSNAAGGANVVRGLKAHCPLRYSKCTVPHAMVGDPSLIKWSFPCMHCNPLTLPLPASPCQVELFVVDLKPAESVCVIETELEVRRSHPSGPTNSVRPARYYCYSFPK